MTPEAQHILKHALSDRTKAIYFQCWKGFLEFCNAKRIHVNLPITDKKLVNYLANLCIKGYKVNTIAAHSSALAYINKYFGFKDFSDSFLVKQFFKGTSNLQLNHACPDTRLPVTHELLQKLLKALPFTITNFYNRTIFATMCILAFHGFLRIGELCIKRDSDKDSGHAILTHNVTLLEQHSGLDGVQIQLHSFKHSNKPVTLFLPGQRNCPLTCPVLAVRNYRTYFKHKDGPFFQFLNGEPVTYAFFNENLNNVIAFLGFDTSKYKSHSFRIGAATFAAMQGHSEEVIKRLGRWKTNAVQNYIRLPVLKLSSTDSI